MCFCETNPPFFDRICIVSGYEYMRCTGNAGAKSVGSFWKTNPPERVLGVVSGEKWGRFRETKPVAAADGGLQPEVYMRKLAPQAGLEPATRALTVRCSTIELLRNRKVVAFYIGDRPSFVNSARAWSGFW